MCNLICSCQTLSTRSRRCTSSLCSASLGGLGCFGSFGIWVQLYGDRVEVNAFKRNSNHHEAWRDPMERKPWIAYETGSENGWEAGFSECETSKAVEFGRFLLMVFDEKAKLFLFVIWWLHANMFRSYTTQRDLKLFVYRTRCSKYIYRCFQK